ncbi:MULTISPECIES: hypothetical protein [Rhizobium]|uniref:Uncharacterized protein n=1 Tax=Rhizobium rhododendri TaxID=2506430 RepID=A0ABY8IM75_9HYPH|nr:MULTISPECIES: hypothetical protein [Rhizobium]MBZ5843031.1 hypothetical protein [Rhizobium sp. VS19-DR104.1]QXZ77391.1 hypothetical protein J5274_12315 [Rhizobium sp. L51/94]TQX91441.1 hypothetical protein EQW76_01520 [Rhizobium sp. rho-13.1]TQY19054.1 hypothetical protein EQW74_04905 [Rhizobium sp. rho-1.1]WFS24100.1 hypothetical protein PR018_06280 [Rhizobium rhododendri]
MIAEAGDEAISRSKLITSISIAKSTKQSVDRIGVCAAANIFGYRVELAHLIHAARGTNLREVHFTWDFT